MDCLFCKLIAGVIPSKKVFEDDLCFAFEDMHPQAPTHVLIVPKKHIASLAQTTSEDHALMGTLLATAATLARAAGLSGGYRTVINTGHDGGQTVDHLHLHLLGGRSMSWPPG